MTSDDYELILLAKGNNMLTTIHSYRIDNNNNLFRNIDGKYPKDKYGKPIKKMIKKVEHQLSGMPTPAQTITYKNKVILASKQHTKYIYVLELHTEEWSELYNGFYTTQREVNAYQNGKIQQMETFKANKNVPEIRYPKYVSEKTENKGNVNPNKHKTTEPKKSIPIQQALPLPKPKQKQFQTAKQVFAF